MLPFLDPKKTTHVIMTKPGKQDLELKPELEAPGEPSHPLKEASEDIMRAINQKSAIDLAHALQAAFETYDATDMGDDQEDTE